MAGKTWLKKEIDYVRRYVIFDETNKALNIPEMARGLGRSESAVKNRIAGLQEAGQLPKRIVSDGLWLEAHNKRYTKAEKKRIISMWNRYFSVKEIAESIGRSHASVRHQIDLLRSEGVHLERRTCKWTDEKVDLLKDNIKFDIYGCIDNLDELTRILGASTLGVKNKVRRLRETKEIDVKVMGVSVRSRNGFRREDAIRFKRQFTPQKSDEINGKKVIQVIVEIKTINGRSYTEYRTQQGKLLKKEPTPVPASEGLRK